jgi:hypothetical protein
MSNIDDKISDYKLIIADLEKQKKDEEEAYKDTIDWNMEQLDKYVEEIETKVKKWKIGKEKELRSNPGNDGLNYDFYISENSSVFRSDQYSKSMRYEYVEQLKYPVIYIKRNNGTTQEVNIKHHYHHIFEFVYKILKHLFTSNKKLSNDYDNVISRLNKLEEENRQLKTCQINYFDIKDRLNIIQRQLKILSQNDMKNKIDVLERENKQFKEKLSDYLDELENKINTTKNDMRLDILEEENRQLKTCQINYCDIKERLNIIEIGNKQLKEILSSYNNVIFDDLEERLDILENENKYLKEKLYDLI